MKKLRRRGFHQLDRQRNVALRFVVEPDVHGIQAGFVELQLLDVDDEIARDEMHVVRQRDWHRDFDGRHNRPAVGVDEVQLQLALALLAGHESDAQRDGALRMHGGHLRRVNRVEGAEQVELAAVLVCRVAQHSHLNVHAENLDTKLENWQEILSTDFATERLSKSATAEMV